MERRVALRDATRCGILAVEVTQDMENELYKALMAMTEAEAAALAFLDTLEQARAAMRAQIETYRERGKTPQ